MLIDNMRQSTSVPNLSRFDFPQLWVKTRRMITNTLPSSLIKNLWIFCTSICSITRSNEIVFVAVPKASTLGKQRGVGDYCWPFAVFTVTIKQNTEWGTTADHLQCFPSIRDARVRNFEIGTSKAFHRIKDKTDNR